MPLVRGFRILWFHAAIFAIITAASPAQLPQGTAWTYQGMLNVGGAPLDGTADFEFMLWDADSGGNQIGPVVEVGNVPVVNGLFAVDLDFGIDVYDGRACWIETSVAHPSGEGVMTTLSPRQAMTATPIALALRGLRTIESGDIEFHPDSWNVLSGHPGNSIAADIGGAVVAGGGRPGALNRVSASLGTISGGGYNLVSASSSTIGGGYHNTTSGNSSTISGGETHVASGVWSTIGGGSGNHVSGKAATVGGGAVNSASGEWSVVPGGRFNVAQGNKSLAAGYNAKALHNGTFVWSDGGDVSSTGENQFLIRAIGGVGINKNEPMFPLDVNGIIRATNPGNAPAGSSVAASDPGGDVGLVVERGDGFGGIEQRWDIRVVDDRSFQLIDQTAFDSSRLTVDTAGNVGIGEVDPSAKLDVSGDVEINGTLFMGGAPGLQGIVFPDGSFQPTAASECSGITIVKEYGLEDVTAICPAGMISIRSAYGAKNDHPVIDSSEEIYDLTKYLTYVIQGDLDFTPSNGWAEVGPWESLGVPSYSMHRDDQWVGIILICGCGG